MDEEGGREGGEEGGRAGEREGGREEGGVGRGGREGERERGRVGKRKGGREERGREGGMEGKGQKGREGERERQGGREEESKRKGRGREEGERGWGGVRRTESDYPSSIKWTMLHDFPNPMQLNLTFYNQFFQAIIVTQSFQYPLDKFIRANTQGHRGKILLSSDDTPDVLDRLQMLQVETQSTVKVHNPTSLLVLTSSLLHLTTFSNTTVRHFRLRY